MSTKLFTFTNGRQVAVLEIEPLTMDQSGRIARLTVADVVEPQRAIYADYDCVIDAKYEREYWAHQTDAGIAADILSLSSYEE